jgi:quercetin dioxygenase-like cupin family protein
MPAVADAIDTTARATTGASAYPHTIESGTGERLTFVRRVHDADGEWLEITNEVQPGAGPPMHAHLGQRESLTVRRGRMGAQVMGQEPIEIGVGETATFESGIPHRFWNAGTEVLEAVGFVKPAHNTEYFLTEMYRSTRENGGRASLFDLAWLSHRYRSEVSMPTLPAFLRYVLFPVARLIGALLGKYQRFENSPEPFR